jgi:hypothetical protein
MAGETPRPRPEEVSSLAHKSSDEPEQGSDRVQDPSEAEAMADAMRPHMDRAQRIKKIRNEAEAQLEHDEARAEATISKDELTARYVDHAVGEQDALATAQEEAEVTADAAADLASRQYHSGHESE